MHLLALSKALEARNTLIEAQRADARETAIKTIQNLMRVYELRLIDIHPPQFTYRNPDTGATWSGRGKMPTWLKGKDTRLYRVTTQP